MAGYSLVIIGENRRPPSPTLFPYTTLFRSLPRAGRPSLSPHSDFSETWCGRAGKCRGEGGALRPTCPSHRRRRRDRKSTRLNSSHVANSYAVFCLKNKIHSDVEPRVNIVLG